MIEREERARRRTSVVKEERCSEKAFDGEERRKGNNNRDFHDYSMLLKKAFLR